MNDSGTQGLPLSVAIVSRHRSAQLRRCLRALEYQTYRPFEVIVICDPGSADVLRERTDRRAIRHRIFDQPNIAQARNLATELAAGDVIAFIDDDAIAEPTWLNRLSRAFKNKDVAAAGGFVRGRNGIRFQWRCEEILDNGMSRPLALDAPTIFGSAAEKPVKTHGTNCAFRTSVLRQLGGFDTSFRFYLEDTDLNLRLFQAGFSTAIIPDAEVQHTYAPSPRRNKNRVVRSLYEIAASAGYFAHKHAVTSSQAFFCDQRQRLQHQFLSGEIRRADFIRLQDELKTGFAAGTQRARQGIPRGGIIAPPRPETFRPFLSQPARLPHRFLTTRTRHSCKTYDYARSLAAQGQAVTLLHLELTPRFHSRFFGDNGFWVQRGGILGQSDRYGAKLHFTNFDTRCSREIAALKMTRENSLSVP